MQSEPPARREPIFNLPGVVAAAILVLVAIHVVRTALLSPELDFAVLLDFAVVPARWTAVWDPAQAEAILRKAGAELPSQEAAWWRTLAQYLLSEREAKPWTALTYAFLHGSWPHVFLNSVWLAAFGTPVARRCGGPRFLVLGGLGAVGGAVAHALSHSLSVAPMVGASAAVSGWMAAAARFAFAHRRWDVTPGMPQDPHGRPLQSLRQLVRNRGAATFLVIWFATNLLFGFAAAPLGVTESSIAWEAHLGGFAVGLFLFPWLDRRRETVLRSRP
jgi:membrane associated rhomboid family serine protease